MEEAPAAEAPTVPAEKDEVATESSITAAQEVRLSIFASLQSFVLTSNRREHDHDPMEEELEPPAVPGQQDTTDLEGMREEGGLHVGAHHMKHAGCPPCVHRCLLVILLSSLRHFTDPSLILVHV